MNHDASDNLAAGDGAVSLQKDAVTRLQATVRLALISLHGPIDSIRARFRNGELTRAALIRDASRYMVQLAQRHQLQLTTEAQARLMDLVVDDLTGERLCPQVKIHTEALTLPTLPVHALIFTAYPHVANELYPLMIDAYVADLGAHGRRTLQVIGVHEHWLTSGRCRRAIIFTEEDQGLCEGDLEVPQTLRSAQVLALSLDDELAAHQRIEAILPETWLLNPAGGSALLDDKCWTGACWQQAGVPTPSFVLLSPGQEHNAFPWEDSALIFKPIDGTEGRDVLALAAGTPIPETNTPMLVMPDVDTVRYLTQDGPVRCTVRVNACWDGQPRIESGYAQIGGSPEGIASAGRGGRIVSLSDLWSNLCRQDGSRLTPGLADWRRLLDTAAAGMAALAGALGETLPRLVGLDLLLDIDQHGSLCPLLLEANPRPSGMCHSRFLSPDGPGDEPGVTQCYWQLLDTGD